MWGNWERRRLEFKTKLRILKLACADRVEYSRLWVIVTSYNLTIPVPVNAYVHVGLFRARRGLGARRPGNS
jgi:hypothetical protein